MDNDKNQIKIINEHMYIKCNIYVYSNSIFKNMYIILLTI